MPKKSGEPTKIEKLRNFVKNLPKDWDSLPRKEKVAAAAKASGMTEGSVGVAISTKPDLRKAFGLSEKPARRGGRRRRGRKPSVPALRPVEEAAAILGRSLPAAGASSSAAVRSVMVAIRALTLEQMLEVNRLLRREIQGRVEAVQREIGA